MRFLSRHRATQAQEEALTRLLAAHGLPADRLVQVDVDLSQPVAAVARAAGLRPFEPVAAVGPAHLLERLRRGGHPVVVSTAVTRGRRVDEAGTVEAHVLPGLATGDHDTVVGHRIVGTLAEITLRDGYSRSATATS